MKAFLAVTVARQIEGDMVWVKVEKANTKASVIDQYVKQNANQYLETMNTEFGPIECQCIRSSMEIELEGDINAT